MKALIYLFTICSLALGQILSEPQKNFAHVTVSGATTLVGCYSADQVKNLTLEQVCVVGVFVGMVPGVFKECLDESGGFDFSANDLIYDFSGCIVTAAIYYTVNRILKKRKESPKIIELCHQN